MKVFTPDDIFGMTYPEHPTAKWMFKELNRQLAQEPSDDSRPMERVSELNGATTTFVIPKKVWKKFAKKAKKAGWHVKITGTSTPETMVLSPEYLVVKRRTNG